MFKRKKVTTLYRFYHRNGSLLYIGIAYNPLRRLGQHTRSKKWAIQIKKITLEVFDTRREALEAEERAIKKEEPKYNKQHNPNYKRNKAFDLWDVIVEFFERG